MNTALKHLMGRVLLPLAVLLGLLGSPARAEIWGYVDDRGIVHFAAEKLDERYELYYKGNDVFDTQAALDADRRAMFGIGPITPALQARADKLRLYFDISPGYKAVQHHLKDASKKHDIDLELLKALIVTESGFDPGAVSPKGAVGLMQLMPATAQRFGVRADPQKTIEQKLTDPKLNVQAGTSYFKYLTTLFPGRTDLVLAAYNAGEGAVQKAGNKIPDFKETQNYVKTIQQLYQAMKPAGMAFSGVAAARSRVAGGRVHMELDALPRPDLLPVSQPARALPPAAAPDKPQTRAAAPESVPEPVLAQASDAPAADAAADADAVAAPPAIGLTLSLCLCSPSPTASPAPASVSQQLALGWPAASAQ